jgi:predicted nucleic acid-binding protein
MTSVFVDTSAFYALIDKDDRFHAQAVTLFRRGDKEDWSFVTASTNIYETYTLILGRIGKPSLALGFLDRVRDGLCEVILVSRRHHDAATALVRKSPNRKYSLFDALGFVIMAEQGIHKALAFDRHFMQYGRFELL